ncbi:LysR family substrate-binding domain-containing protein [Streptomyces sp. NPDC127117]|uniref:LysR family substrate-binding domain-containing protein n=1 Tax=Streptomyces sp. NPDC127117 TaxID=3345368 RepID=UPI00364165A3
MHQDIQEMTTAPQIAALYDRTIGIGLLRGPPADEAEAGFETVLPEPFVAALPSAPSAHPLAAQRAVPLAQLADSPFVSLPREAGPQPHDRITGLCVAAGSGPRVVQRAAEWRTVCALVETGLGAGLLSTTGENSPVGHRRDMP